MGRFMQNNSRADSTLGGLPAGGTSPLEWPMERNLIAVMAAVAAVQTRPWQSIYLGIDVADFSDFPPLHTAGLVIGREIGIGVYRADFAILARAYGGFSVRVAVECDGHSYHERTAEQAAHDRARDRQFSARGIWPLRFTGVEIRTDAARCASEAIQIALGRSAP